MNDEYKEYKEYEIKDYSELFYSVLDDSNMSMYLLSDEMSDCRYIKLEDYFYFTDIYNLHHLLFESRKSNNIYVCTLKLPLFTNVEIGKNHPVKFRTNKVVFIEKLVNIDHTLINFLVKEKLSLKYIHNNYSHFFSYKFNIQSFLYLLNKFKKGDNLLRVEKSSSLEIYCNYKYYNVELYIRKKLGVFSKIIKPTTLNYIIIKYDLENIDEALSILYDILIKFKRLQIYNITKYYIFVNYYN